MKRLAIWRDERLDRHVTHGRAKHMVSGFFPRINICAFADWRSDLRSVAYGFILIHFLNRRKCSL